MLTTGILEVLYCVLIESPEVLNIIQENHIKSIISLLDKHGRNHKVSEYVCRSLKFIVIIIFIITIIKLYYLGLCLSREVFTCC